MEGVLVRSAPIRRACSLCNPPRWRNPGWFTGSGGGLALAPAEPVWFDCSFGPYNTVIQSLSIVKRTRKRAARPRINLASDEKNLSAPQSATNKNSRIPGPDGLAGRPQGAQAPAREGPQAPGDLDSAQTARLVPFQLVVDKGDRWLGRGSWQARNLNRWRRKLERH